jgi:ATP-binding cassette subfamily B protein
MGVQTSKAFVKEQDNMNRFSDLTDQMLGSSVLNAVQAALYLPLVLTLGSLATGLALVIGGYQVMGGLITAGTLVAFLTYTRHFFEPIEELAHWFAELQMAQASAERIFSLIEAEPEIRDSSNVIDAIDFNRNRIRHLELHIAEDGMSSLISRIEFRNVSFAYSNGPEVLKNINLTIEQGQSIAIVGSTGGGKSTLANLLCRFYEPTSGSIFIDGVDYRQRSLYWLQSNLGIVLQASHLFGGTIADNIRYSKPGATLNEIIEAAKLAGANNFITRLNQGYDFVLTESGNNLSAGQKQLIAFTRAILADPRILVMDEATSSIDTITEHYIQKGMKQLLQGRISLIIAHRLSTIRNADRIIVVESGQIVEQGSHRELMSLGQRYRTLYSQQRLCSGSPDVGIWQETQTIDAAT